MAYNSFRIDPDDGSDVIEYRIDDGWVERRTGEGRTRDGVYREAQWERLTPNQLFSEIMTCAAFAYWLYQGLGSQMLLHACSPSVLD